MLKIDVRIAFPLGAKFNKNINELTYRSFLKMIKRLSCVSVDTKCKECPIKSNCQYYRITGENFQGYPGIIFTYSSFSKRLFREGEELKYQIYVVGNNIKLKSYVELFFSEYLNYKLYGYPFVLKEYQETNIEEYARKIEEARLFSLVEKDKFEECYNEMIHYYNSHYETKYKLLDEAIQTIDCKRVMGESVFLPTRRINKKGYIYKIKTPIRISSDILSIGVGKFNYLGGGKIEIKN